MCNLSYCHFESVTHRQILSHSVWRQQKVGEGDGKPNGPQDLAMFPAIVYCSDNKAIVVPSLLLTSASLSLSQLFLPADQDEG